MPKDQDGDDDSDGEVYDEELDNDSIAPKRKLGTIEQ